VRINLSEIETRSFEALPAGRYVVEVTGFEMRATKGGEDAKLPKDTPYVNWEFTVVRGPGAETKYQNRKVWTNTILHERTLFSLKGLLEACGWTDEQLNDPEGIDFDPDKVVGNQCIIRVAVRPYNGDDTNDVKGFFPLSAEKSETTGASSLLP
jgi:hypothetical protein